MPNTKNDTQYPPVDSEQKGQIVERDPSEHPMSAHLKRRFSTEFVL
jgi:hypothetical protein